MFFIMSCDCPNLWAGSVVNARGSAGRAGRRRDRGHSWSDCDSFSSEYTWRIVELFDGSYKLVAGIKISQVLTTGSTNYQLGLFCTTRQDHFC